MFSKFTTSATTNPQHPAPLPFDPLSGSQHDEDGHHVDSPRDFKFPASTSSDDATPPSPSPSRNRNMPPPALPVRSISTRIPRLSLVASSRDQYQAHKNRLSMGGSQSSLKDMMEKDGGKTITMEIRVECLERRVRNSKEDAVGLAKDILSLCEEAASSKQGYLILDDKIVSLVNQLVEYRDENQSLRSSQTAQKLRTEELVSTVSKLAKQLNNQANAHEELHAEFEEQKDVNEQLERKSEEQERKLNELLSSVNELLSSQRDRRDESFMTSVTSFSDSTVTGASTPDFTAILARLEALENAPAPSIPAAPTIPTTPAQVAEANAKLRRVQDDLEREERRARQKQLDAIDKEARLQVLLQEAVAKTIALTTRVKELEATAKLASSSHNVFSNSVSSSNAVVYQTTPSAHAPKDRKSLLSGAGAPSIPALDPFSPFVVDKGAGAKMRGLVRGRGNGLRE